MFHDEPASAVVYRDRLRKHVEETVRVDLEATLQRVVCAKVDDVQQAIVDRISELIPEEKKDFLQVTPRRLPLELNFLLAQAALGEFVADLSFKSSLAPRRMLHQYRRLRRCLLARAVGLEEEGSPIWWWLRKAAAAACLTSCEVAAGATLGLALLSSRSRFSNWRPLLLSTTLALSAAHVCERALWTPAAKERELRRQFRLFSERRLRPLRPLLTAHCRSSAQKELASTLVLACGAAEGAGLELGREARKAAVDCQMLVQGAASAERAAARTDLAQRRLKQMRDEALMTCAIGSSTEKK